MNVDEVLISLRGRLREVFQGKVAGTKSFGSFVDEDVSGTGWFVYAHPPHRREITWAVSYPSDKAVFTNDEAFRVAQELHDELRKLIQEES